MTPFFAFFAFFFTQLFKMLVYFCVLFASPYFIRHFSVIFTRLIGSLCIFIYICICVYTFDESASYILVFICTVFFLAYTPRLHIFMAARSFPFYDDLIVCYYFSIPSFSYPQMPTQVSRTCHTYIYPLSLGITARTITGLEPELVREYKVKRIVQRGTK